MVSKLSANRCYRTANLFGDVSLGMPVLFEYLNLGYFLLAKLRGDHRVLLLFGWDKKPR